MRQAMMLLRVVQAGSTSPSDAVRAAMLMAGAILAALLPGISAAPAAEVTVRRDGSFDPQWVWVHDGDTVVWHLSDETDTIIPVRTVFPAGVEPDLEAGVPDVRVAVRRVAALGPGEGERLPRADPRRLPAPAAEPTLVLVHRRPPGEAGKGTPSGADGRQWA